jgi:hypothetical protein
LSRVAVVFHGIVGGSKARNGIGELVDFATCSKLIKHSLPENYSYDFFIHSWSTEVSASLVELYSPVKYKFEPQEFFNFSFTPEEYVREEATHSFRTVSRFNSLERAIALKREYEEENDFKYDWVLALRFDLVILNKLNFELDPSNFYICYEPHWPNIHLYQMIHDVMFLSSSKLMDTYSSIAEEIRIGMYKDILDQSHRISYRKLCYMNCKIEYFCRRFEDVDIYRFVVNPDLNELGKSYGGLETFGRMQAILKEVE